MKKIFLATFAMLFATTSLFAQKKYDAREILGLTKEQVIEIFGEPNGIYTLDSSSVKYDTIYPEVKPLNDIIFEYNNFNIKFASFFIPNVTEKYELEKETELNKRLKNLPDSLEERKKLSAELHDFLDNKNNQYLYACTVLIKKDCTAINLPNNLTTNDTLEDLLDIYGTPSSSNDGFYIYAYKKMRINIKDKKMDFLKGVQRIDITPFDTFYFENNKFHSAMFIKEYELK